MPEWPTLFALRRTTDGTVELIVTERKKSKVYSISDMQLRLLHSLSSEMLAEADKENDR